VISIYHKEGQRKGPGGGGHSHFQFKPLLLFKVLNRIIIRTKRMLQIAYFIIQLPTHKALSIFVLHQNSINRKKKKKKASILRNLPKHFEQPLFSD
jgi:hypothetical protein